MTTSFISELARRLQGQGPSLALPLTWIEQRLAESNQTIDQMVQLGNQQQAADQVSISNSIHSLRTLGAIDWREFCRSHQHCRTNVARGSGVYGRMDFSSRDRYRHAVERLAYGQLSEVDVAREALRLAREAEASGHGNARAHVGFYLVDSGLPILETAVPVQLPVSERFFRIARRYPLFSYLCNRAHHATVDPKPRRGSAGGGREWLAIGLAGGFVIIRDESSRHSAGQLDLFSAGDAPFAAAYGFRQGNPARISDTGGGPNHPCQRVGGKPAYRGA